MFSFTTLCIATTAAVAVAQVPRSPNFPKSWSAQETSSISIAQGSTTGPNGEQCCSPTAANCQIQIQGEAGMHYWDGEGNQTRFDNTAAGQIIVTQYNIGKEMLVDGTGACQQYCPTEGEMDPSPFWPSPADHETVKDLGKETIKGVETEHYQWVERILGIITVQTTNLYVAPPAAAGDFATPVYEHDILEPFGQEIGEEDTTWTNFKAGQPDASLFKVTGIADCEESPNCNQYCTRNASCVCDEDLLNFLLCFARDWDSLQRDRLRRRDYMMYAKYAQQSRDGKNRK